MAKRSKQLRFGAVDDTGAWKFEPKFEQVGLHGDGRIPFAEGKRWGFADLAGTTVVSPRYDFVHPFTGGVACVETAGGWSAIAVDGSPATGWRGPMVDGRARTSNAWPSRDRTEPSDPAAQFGFVDDQGKILVEPRFMRAHDYQRGRAMVQLERWKFAYLDRDGQFAIPAFEAIDARDFDDGDRARVKGSAGTWRVIAADGTTVLETGFQMLSSFVDGLARVASDDKVSKWGPKLVGFIDERGQLAIERQFEAAEAFSGGLAKVTVRVGPTPTCGFIDREGKLVIEPTFRNAHTFAGEVAPACVRGASYSTDAWGLIDRQGQWRVEPTLRAITPFVDGAARFRREDGSWGLFDDRGEVIAEGYTALEHAGYPCGANRGGKLGKSDKVTGGKWGFVDARGRELVPCEHTAIATGFRSGIAGVGDHVSS